MTAAYIDPAAIKNRYAPYNTFPSFELGYADYLAGHSSKMLSGVDGQAYDRGYEAGMKVSQASEWIERNVGAN